MKLLIIIFAIFIGISSCQSKKEVTKFVGSITYKADFFDSGQPAPSGPMKNTLYVRGDSICYFAIDSSLRKLYFLTTDIPILYSFTTYSHVRFDMGKLPARNLDIPCKYEATELMDREFILGFECRKYLIARENGLESDSFFIWTYPYYEFEKLDFCKTSSLSLIEKILSDKVQGLPLKIIGKTGPPFYRELEMTATNVSFDVPPIEIFDTIRIDSIKGALQNGL